MAICFPLWRRRGRGSNKKAGGRVSRRILRIRGKTSLINPGRISLTPNRPRAHPGRFRIGLRLDLRLISRHSIVRKYNGSGVHRESGQARGPTTGINFAITTLSGCGNATRVGSAASIAHAAPAL